MLASATIGSIKSMLVTVNAVVATQFNVSYMATTALTGLPIIFGALAGLQSQVLSQFVGKRAIYLASSIVMLLAVLWNMHVSGSYAQFMVSRLFQGLAWGAMEGLVGESVNDLYLVCISLDI